jgi:hypothetical protein
VAVNFKGRISNMRTLRTYYIIKALLIIEIII